MDRLKHVLCRWLGHRIRNKTGFSIELGTVWDVQTCERCGKSRVVWLKGDYKAYFEELRIRRWA